MKRTLITIVFLPLFAALLYAGGESEGSAPAPATEERAPVTTEEPAAETEEEGSPPIGEETRRLLEASGLRVFKERVPSIDFTLPHLDGGQVSLSDYQGSVVLLNFWATWCPPCREELPSMVRLQEELGADNFTILAVSLREEREIVSSFLEENGFDLPVLLDGSGAVGTQYGVRGIPTSYVLDANGRVLGMLVGAREWDDPEVIDLMRHLGTE
jgi:thiol-disulfide isomerase/thioredoxin